MSVDPWGDDPATTAFTSRASDVADIAAIQEFIDEGMVASILGVVKSGKEATVYRCQGTRAVGGLVAAKVYHESAHRGFNRAGDYEQGRWVGSRTMRAAIAAKKDLGRQFQLGLWVEHEFETLSNLGYAGADVPEVFACTERAILMEFIGDDQGAAPLLQHAPIRADEAGGLFGRLLWNIELWLRNDVVHGDLSPFNILYRRGRLVVIDFPQAVDPRSNPSARRLLDRDVHNVAAFFARHGVNSDARTITHRLWESYRRGWR